MINNYYYSKQIKKFILGFANVFTGLQVKTGKDENGDVHCIEVPIRYGSSDRVVAAIATGNTTNKMHTLPIMSCYLTSLELAPDRLHGVGTVNYQKYLKQGDVYPTDIKAIERVMPIPYNMIMELAIYASNTDQMFQIIEQLLIMFDYTMQIQFNDAPFDWTQISKIQLNSINNEEQYPMGTNVKTLIWTLSFEMPIWLSPPAEIRSEILSNINIRMGNMDGMSMDEYDFDGKIVPFDTVFGELKI